MDATTKQQLIAQYLPELTQPVNLEHEEISQTLGQLIIDKATISKQLQKVIDKYLTLVKENDSLKDQLATQKKMAKG